MSFYVYAKKLTTKVDFTVISASGYDVTSNAVQFSGTAGASRISEKFFKTNEWQKVYYVFTANPKSASANELFFSVRMAENSETELYIDNIQLDEFTDDMGAVSFNTSVYNNLLVDLSYNYIVGKVGEKIVFPKGIKEDYRLEGWYTAYTLGTAFKDTFQAGEKTAYAQWDISGSRKISFESSSNYTQDGIGTPTSNRYTNINGGKVVTGEKASDGIASYKIDSNDKYWRSDVKALALKEIDGSPFRLVNNKTYIISVDVYVANYSSDFTFWFTTGSQDNYYAWMGTTTGRISVNASVPRGQWITTSMTYTTAFSSPGGFNLFLCSGGPKGTVVYYDNIVVEEVNENQPVVVMNAGLLAGSTQRISGKPGDPYSLPRNLNVPGYSFVGWYNTPSLDKAVDFDDVFIMTRTVYAKLIPNVITQDFENYTFDFSLMQGADTDYEIYDSKKKATHLQMFTAGLVRCTELAKNIR